MWKAVEAEIGKVGMAEAKSRKGQRESGEKTGRVGKKEAEGKKSGRDKKSSGEIGNLG